MKKPFVKSRQQLFVDDPIYTKYDLADLKSADITKFFRGEGSVDAYCLACGQRSVFRIPGIGYGFDDEKNAVKRFGVIVLEASCQRENTEPYLDRCAGKLIACFWRDGDCLTKIGQYPSKADLEFGQDDPVLKGRAARALWSDQRKF